MKFNNARGCETPCFPLNVKCRVGEVVGEAEVNVGNSSSEIHGFRSVYQSWGRQCEWLLDSQNLESYEGCVFINAKGWLGSLIFDIIYWKVATFF